MSEPSKGSRSLRPRAKLKRPEFYDQSEPTSAAASSSNTTTSNSQLQQKEKVKSKKQKKEAILHDEAASSSGGISTTTTRAKKRQSNEHKQPDEEKKRRKSSTVGGCTSLQSRRDRRQRMSDQGGNQDQQQQQQQQNNQPGATQNSNEQSNEENTRRMAEFEQLFQARGIPPHFFSNLAPRMQQFLQQHMMPMPNARSSQIIQQLNHQGIGALPGLEELCEMLCMGNEDNLSGFNFREAVPLLIKLLQDQEVQVSQAAARALTYLLDSLPRSSHAVAQAIPALLARVANIFDDALIMVAEQSLSCLEKLAQKHGRAILTERGADQVTTFLDFFSIVAQRHALATCVSCYKAVSDRADFEMIKGTIPIMIMRLKSGDKKSVEHAVQACATITEKLCAWGDRQGVEYLAEQDLVQAAADIVCDPNNVSVHYITMSLRMLRQLALHNHALAVTMTTTQLPQALAQILTFDLQSSPQREAQELIEAVKLVEAMLPHSKTIQDPIANLTRHYDDTDSEDEEEDEDDEQQQQAKEQPIQKEENIVQDKVLTDAELDQVEPLITQIYPLLWKLLTAAPNSSLRIAVIHALLRMSYCCRPTTLEVLLNAPNCAASGQIQQLLDAPDVKVAVRALQLTRAVLTIVPSFTQKFRREGLYHTLNKLTQAKQTVKSPMTPGPSSSLSTPKTSHAAGDSSASVRGSARRKLLAAVATGETPVDELVDALEGAKEPSKEEGGASSSTSTLSGISTPTIRKRFPAHCRMRFDSTSQKELLLNWIRDESKNLLELFFTEAESDTESGLEQRMNVAKDGLNSEDKATRAEALKVLTDVIINHDISPFELLHTGILSTLLLYLLKPGRPLEFIQTIAKLPPLNPTATVDDNALIIPSDNEAFIRLVHKINQIISQVERYPVKLKDGSSSSNTRLRQLNQQQIKCNLQRDPSCTKTKNWTNGLVKIEPLAPVSAIERHLVMKGFGQPQTETSSGPEDNMSDSDDDAEATPSFAGFMRGTRQVELLIKGKSLPPNITIYQAIREYEIDDESEPESDDDEYQQTVWSRTFTINYRIISKESATKKKEEPKKSFTLGDIKPLANDDPLWSGGLLQQRKCPLTLHVKMLHLEHHQSGGELREMVSLLSCLFGLSRFWQTMYPSHVNCSPKPLCLPEEFENGSLTSKCWRQLQDPLCVLSGNIPNWLVELVQSCPFLFPFDLRRYLFYITTFDRQRAIQKLNERMPEYEAQSTTGNNRQIQARVPREKVVVNRDKLLKSAETLFDNYKTSNAAIDIQYLNEVGTGLGPTLEFYTLVSQELRRAELRLWRCGEPIRDENLKVNPLANEGLFPAPLGKTVKKSALNNSLHKFRLLGRCMARSLKDSRMIDLPISMLMSRVLLDEMDYFHFYDLQSLDSQLYRSLQQLKSFIYANQTDSVEELYLDFNLPGYANIELMKDGRKKPVNGDNLDQYIDLVAHWSMSEGVRRQFDALRCGFGELFDIGQLKLFMPWELARLFCGSEQHKWTISDLESAIRPDHGYTQSCRAVQFLYTCLSELDNQQQADFVRFVTGSPHLPVGGLKALSPPLTVVKKTVGEGENPENFLPSVMTCVNYLKLPDYTNLEIMRKKLLQAITDGQGAFLLS